MKNKFTNLIFVFTFLTIAHHFYIGSSWNLRDNDRYDVGNSTIENSIQKETLQEL